MTRRDATPNGPSTRAVKRTLFSFLCLLTAFARGADIKFTPDENYYKALATSADTDNPLIKSIAAKLARSRVPTRDAAEKIALHAFATKPGLDAREKWAVSGLYRLGRDVPDFGASGDLIWEVRVSRIGSGVSGIVWVSSSTAAARTLFP